MRKTLWVILGLFFVGCAYIGIILPGVPTTFFVILAAWAFSKSSEKFNKWIHEHKLFGKYLTNWETKRIYPYRGRYAMVGVMVFIIIIYVLHITSQSSIIRWDYFYIDYLLGI